MSQDNFDNFIKQKADGHEAPVPADAWNNIIREKKKRPYFIFWWSLSSLLIIGILFIYIHSTKIHNISLATNQGNRADSALSQSNNNAENNFKRNNNKSSNTNNDTITTLQVQQKNNNADNNKQYKDVVNSTISIQNSKLKESQQEPLSQAKDQSLKISKNEPVVPISATGKKHLYTQKAKYKTTVTGASINSETIDKPYVNTPDNNNTSTENDTKIKINNNTVIQKNDSINTLITGIQKKQGIDSAIKTNEKDTAKTKTINRNNTTTNTTKKIKDPVLILDFSATPFSPIQHYDQMEYITRIDNNNTVHSTYSANSVQTSLQSSVAFAIDIKKNISKKIIIGTGIQYAHINETIQLSGQETDTTYSVVQRLIINGAARYLGNDTIANISSGVRNIKAINSYQLFSIPLFANYTFLNHKIFSLSLTAGIYFNIAQYHNSISGELQSVYTNGIQPVNKKNTITTDIFGGLRLSWLVSKKFQLFTEPGFRYNLNKYELKNTFINKNINQAGISAGLSYRIK